MLRRAIAVLLATVLLLGTAAQALAYDYLGLTLGYSPTLIVLVSRANIETVVSYEIRGGSYRPDYGSWTLQPGERVSIRISGFGKAEVCGYQTTTWGNTGLAVCGSIFASAAQ